MVVFAFLIFLMTYLLNGVDDLASDSSMNFMDTLNLSQIFMGLVVAVFTVTFVTSDATSGYIKNIGGQFACRSNIVIARAIALIACTFVYTAEYFIIQILADQIIIGSFTFGKTSDFILAFLFTWLLHFAFSMVCMMISIVIKKSGVAMAVSIILGLRMTESLLYDSINIMVNDGESTKFDIHDYMLIGNITNMVQNIKDSCFAQLVIVGVIYAVAAILISCLVFEKRDIV
jgi:ABC-type transport system involved in multi-copper enzyme maturation permease subunit